MSITFRMPGAVLTEREHTVPLVHADPSRGMIRVFTREVAIQAATSLPLVLGVHGHNPSVANADFRVVHNANRDADPARRQPL